MKQNSIEITRRLNTKFLFVYFFAKKSHFVIELYCLSTLGVLLNTSIHSNYCLSKLGVT